MIRVGFGGILRITKIEEALVKAVFVIDTIRA
jgi:hypothetical protein